MTSALLPARDHPSHRSAKARAEQRRRAVAGLLHRGHTEAEIAVAVGAAASTVHYDIHYLRRQWYVENLETINEAVAQDLGRLGWVLTCLSDRVATGEPKAAEAYCKVIELANKLRGTLAGGNVSVDIEGYVRRVAQENGFDGDEAVELAHRITVTRR